MPDLIAQGPETHHRWRRPVMVGESFVVGRDAGVWSVPWDDRVSRQHVELHWHKGKLSVRHLSSARNPVFFGGAELPEFSLRTGEHFVIGQTTFSLVEEQVSVSLEVPVPLEEQVYSPQELRRVRFQNADHRIDVLSRMPEMISGAASDSELCVRLVNMLLAGIARATAVAVVAIEDKSPEKGIRVLHWDRRFSLEGGEFHPSQRLIVEAIGRGESVLHVWGGRDGARHAFTLRENVDWAFCTPVRGPSAPEWAIYVAGRFILETPRISDAPGSSDLREELKFAELVASTLGSLRELRQLQGKLGTLGQFFAPAVLSAMAHSDTDAVLAPRETDVSVLFCDLRGFSYRAEREASDLLGLLNRVSQALGVMTHAILDQGGVVGDFQGDAAMGFWNWPLPQADAVTRACSAALTIRAEFESAARCADHPLADFRMGIGLASGRAVAGKIGTVDQVKVTVFGPVVNLASRLEGMTKILRTPILIDDVTAQAVRNQVPREVARVRRIAIVKPYGMEIEVEVSELLPPLSAFPELSDADLANYELALEEFLAGRWGRSLELLHLVPAHDRVKDFLTVFIVQNNRTPPRDFRGVIPLGSKS